MTRKQKTEKALTLTDVVIPAGSEVTRIPFVRAEKWDYVSVRFSHGDDAMSEWTMPTKEAVRMGIVPADFGDKPEKPPKKEEEEVDYPEQVPESFA